MAYRVTGYVFEHASHVPPADLERALGEAIADRINAEKRVKEAKSALDAWYLENARKHLCVVDGRVNTASERGY